MKPAPFDYHRPETLDDAIALLRELGPDARPLAGGQSLIPFMNFRLARPRALVDLNMIPELTGIAADDGQVVVGAMTRQWDAEHSDLVREKTPMVPDALRWVGHTATRSRGTIGGSIAHGDPAAELPAVALALDAEMTVASKDGTRRVPARDFFQDHYTTAVDTGELLVDVRFPITPDEVSWSFREFAFRSGDFAIAAAAVHLTRENHNHIGETTISLGGVAATPIRAEAAESLLRGAPPTQQTWKRAAEAAAANIDPTDDEDIPSGYRRQIVATLVEDALIEAWEGRE